MSDKSPVEKDLAFLKKHDQLLLKALKFLKSLPHEERTIAVAGVYDTQAGELYIAPSRQVSRESEFGEYGLWSHAEYEAMGLALENGVDPSNAIVITTLSPSLNSSNHCVHDAAGKILAKEGFCNIYTGHIDGRQGGIDAYEAIGLNVTVTENAELSDICAKLNNYFDPSRENRRTGESKQDYIEEVLMNLPEEV
jgi:hypothetical protein